MTMIWNYLKFLKNAWNTYLATTFGASLQKFAIFIWNRCFRTVSQQLQFSQILLAVRVFVGKILHIRKDVDRILDWRPKFPDNIEDPVHFGCEFALKISKNSQQLSFFSQYAGIYLLLNCEFLCKTWSSKSQKLKVVEKVVEANVS